MYLPCPRISTHQPTFLVFPHAWVVTQTPQPLDKNQTILLQTLLIARIDISTDSPVIMSRSATQPTLTTSKLLLHFYTISHPRPCHVSLCGCPLTEITGACQLLRQILALGVCNPISSLYMDFTVLYSKTIQTIYIKI